MPGICHSVGIGHRGGIGHKGGIGHSGGKITRRVLGGYRSVRILSLGRTAGRVPHQAGTASMGVPLPEYRGRRVLPLGAYRRAGTAAGGYGPQGVPPASIGYRLPFFSSWAGKGRIPQMQEASQSLEVFAMAIQGAGGTCLAAKIRLWKRASDLELLLFARCC